MRRCPPEHRARPTSRTKNPSPNLHAPLPCCSFNETLMRENELFESHLRRVNPQLLAGDDDASAKKRKSGAAAKKAHAVLTPEQKYEIASQEMEEVRDEIEATKGCARRDAAPWPSRHALPIEPAASPAPFHPSSLPTRCSNSEKLLDSLRASMEETDVRISEIKKDAYEFKRDIVTGAENFRTGKTIAEKAVRYMEEKLRAKGAMAEKLRLKNMTLKSQIQKMEGQLQQKEDMGEVLHVIDFDQLKIENQQYLEKIEERNNELLRLKLTTGNTVQVLNTLKHKLNNLTAESEWLKRETTQRKETLAKISEEIARVEQEKEQAARADRKMRRETESQSNMPQVLDYVQQKADMYDLERSVGSWRRKVEIAEMEAKRYTGLAQKQRALG